jgi:hypothetical protein
VSECEWSNGTPEWYQRYLQAEAANDDLYDRTNRRIVELENRLRNACHGEAWVVTELPDGTVVHAHPQHGTEDVARAEALGYPNVGTMTLEHDPLHSVVYNILFGQSSVALRSVHGECAPEIVQAEEEVVLAVQRLLNAVRSKESRDVDQP